MQLNARLLASLSFPKKKERDDVVKNRIEWDFAIQNRFTAYLKVSIIHFKTKYLTALREKQNQELSFDEQTELLNQMENSLEDSYFSGEVEDAQLVRALDRLKERERIIVFRRAVSGESFVRIAAEMGLKYVTAKAIYRRSLEKIRKEMLKK